jgi:PAS domain S-box-containing protein
VRPRDEIVRWSTGIVQSAGDAIVGADLEGRITLWNAATERLLGFTAEEVLGRPVSWLDGLDPAAAARVVAAVGGERAAPHETLWPTRHGQAVPVCVTIAPVRDECGAIVGTSRVARARDQEAGRQGRLYEALFSQAITNFALFDRDFRFIRVNEAYARHYRRPVSDFPGRHYFELFPYDNSPESARILEAIARDGQTFQADGRRYVFEDVAGKPVAYFDMIIQPIVDGRGEVEFLFFSSIDVTDREQAQERLRGSLQEKEVMLREIHHRVKNNLQFISSLLALQAARIDDVRVAEALAESHNRVRAVAMVHDNLYRSQDLSSIPLAAHLESLCAHLFRSYAVDVDRVALDLRVADVRLDLDRSIRCGLITNELVANAIKHAFPDARAGRITVRFVQCPGAYELSVSDDGIGLSAAVDPERTTSLGLQLVGDLAEHLSGSLTVERAGGTTFTIRFPSAAQGAVA